MEKHKLLASSSRSISSDCQNSISIPAAKNTSFEDNDSNKVRSSKYLMDAPLLDCDFEKLVNMIRKLDLTDDGIRMNYKIRDIQRSFCETIASGKEIEDCIGYINQKALMDGDAATKFAILFSSHHFHNLNICQQSVRNVIFGILEDNYTKADEMRRQDRYRLYNFITMLGEYYHRSRLSDNQPIAVIGESLLQLLIYEFNDGHDVNDAVLAKLILSQVTLNGSILFEHHPKEFTELLYLIRRHLILQPSLHAGVKALLLMTLDLYYNDFNSLDRRLEKMYMKFLLNEELATSEIFKFNEKQESEITQNRKSFTPQPLSGSDNVLNQKQSNYEINTVSIKNIDHKENCHREKITLKDNNPAYYTVHRNENEIENNQYENFIDGNNGLLNTNKIHQSARYGENNVDNKECMGYHEADNRYQIEDEHKFNSQNNDSYRESLQKAEYSSNRYQDNIQELNQSESSQNFRNQYGDEVICNRNNEYPVGNEDCINENQKNSQRKEDSFNRNETTAETNSDNHADFDGNERNCSESEYNLGKNKGDQEGDEDKNENNCDKFFNKDNTSNCLSAKLEETEIGQFDVSTNNSEKSNDNISNQLSAKVEEIKVDKTSDSSNQNTETINTESSTKITSKINWYIDCDDDEFQREYFGVEKEHQEDIHSSDDKREYVNQNDNKDLQNISSNEETKQNRSPISERNTEHLSYNHHRKHRSTENSASRSEKNSKSLNRGRRSGKNFRTYLPSSQRSLNSSLVKNQHYPPDDQRYTNSLPRSNHRGTTMRHEFYEQDQNREQFHRYRPRLSSLNSNDDINTERGISDCRSYRQSHRPYNSAIDDKKRKDDFEDRSSNSSYRSIDRMHSNRYPKQFYHSREQISPRRAAPFMNTKNFNHFQYNTPPRFQKFNQRNPERVSGPSRDRHFINEPNVVHNRQHYHSGFGEDSLYDGDNNANGNENGDDEVARASSMQHSRNYRDSRFLRPRTRSNEPLQTRNKSNWNHSPQMATQSEEDLLIQNRMLN